MKKIFLLASLSFLLLATKCKQKSLTIKVFNNSKSDIVFGVEKHSSVLGRIAYITMASDSSKPKKTFLELRIDSINFKNIKKNPSSYAGILDIINRNEKIKLNLAASDLIFYKTTNIKYYTFYFYKIKNNKIIQKTYDSINIKKEKIKIGAGALNTFTYYDNKIVFVSKQ